MKELKGPGNSGNIGYNAEVGHMSGNKHGKHVHHDKHDTMVSPTMVKSPSDMTIYVPALMRSPQIRNGNVDQNVTINGMISDFVETVHLEQRQDELMEAE